MALASDAGFDGAHVDWVWQRPRRAATLVPMRPFLTAILAAAILTGCVDEPPEPPDLASGQLVGQGGGSPGGAVAQSSVDAGPSVTADAGTTTPPPAEPQSRRGY